MDKKDLKKRLKQLAINTGKLCVQLPFNIINKTYIGQVIRSSSSSAANYFSACRGKSKPDFINKLKIVEEFYEMLASFNDPFKPQLRILYKEGNELLSIIVASIKTANSNCLKEASQKIRNPKSK